MSVKTITITEDAYARLSTQKMPGESFSKVIKRITGTNSLMEIAGILSDKEADELRNAVKKIRKDVDEQVKKVAERLR